MIITHLDGRTELLTDYKNLERTRRVNGQYSLSFLLLQTERNQHAYPLVAEESLIEYDGQTYRIKNVAEQTIGTTPIKQIQADHTFFDLVDEFQYETIRNTQTLSTCLAHALENTGYTFEVVDSFQSAVVENWGNNTALALIQDALNLFGAEVEINNTHLRFYQQTGRKTDIQFRFKHNIKTIERHVDTSNLSTYIKGFGKKNDDGSYVVTAEYTSPKASIYGIRHAPPVTDERYTTHSGLLERLQRELQDSPNISFTMETIELLKAGINTEQLELGDEIFIIYEPLNIDINARVVEIVEYPETPNSNRLTLANFRPNLTDVVADFQRTKDRIDGIFDGKERLPYNVLPDAIKRATESLQSAETELTFENGILAIDPTNPSRLVLLNSKGVGISDDGGKTFKEAITADGFVLSAGAVGQLAANNIVVGAGTNFDPDYDPSTKETPEGAKAKAEEARIAAETVAVAQAELARTTAEAHADDIVTAEEQARINDAINKLTEAKTYAEEKASEAQIAAINVAKADAQTKADSAKQAAINASNAEIALAETRAKAHADGKVTTEEAARIAQAEAILEEAKADAKTKADAAEAAAKAVANQAQATATSAKDQVDSWKKTGTTLIDGGNIYTDTLSAISANLGTVKSGLIESSTFQTAQKAPYALLKSDGALVLAASDDFYYNGGDVGIKIDPSSFFDEPRIAFHSSYYHNQGGELGGFGGGSITLLGNPSAPESMESMYINANGPIYLNGEPKESGGDGIIAQTSGYFYVQSSFGVRGTKNAIVPTSIGDILINAYETTESYFGDIGRGQIANGICEIEIDPLFLETINTEIDYEVFLTPYGKGLIYVDSMGPDSFIVKGDDIPFVYEIKAKRKGYEDVRLELAGR